MLIQVLHVFTFFWSGSPWFRSENLWKKHVFYSHIQWVSCQFFTWIRCFENHDPRQVFPRGLIVPGPQLKMSTSCQAHRPQCLHLWDWFFAKRCDRTNSHGKLDSNLPTATNMGVSTNGGTPKWMIYTVKSHEHGWFRGTPISGHPYVLGLGFANHLWSGQNGLPCGGGERHPQPTSEARGGSSAGELISPSDWMAGNWSLMFFCLL